MPDQNNFLFVYNKKIKSYKYEIDVLNKKKYIFIIFCSEKGVKQVKECNYETTVT